MIERLRDQLAELEVERATLLAELAAFEADYLRAVGAVMAELREVEARILALTGDARAAATARERARETTTAIRSIPEPAGPPPSEDLKTLFRDAAKRMHPDLVPGAQTRAHAEAFMKRLNDAYRAGDGDAIRGLVRQWETMPFAAAVTVDPASAERSLRVAVADAQRRLDELRATELVQLMERALVAAAQGRDLLAELELELEAALVAARARLAELEASA